MNIRTPFSKEEIVRVRALHERGLSAELIAKELGRPKGSISGLKYRLGLYRHRPNLDPVLLGVRRDKAALRSREEWHESKRRRERLRRKAEQEAEEAAARRPAARWLWQGRFYNPADRR